MKMMLAATMGMRRGEILGLKWSDISFDAGTVRIVRSLEQTKAGGLAFKNPKTKAGIRTIALPQITIEALRKHRADLSAARLTLGLGKIPEDHLICAAGPNGEPWKPSALTWSFADFIRQSGLPVIRFHDLRHSHASQLLRAGESIKSVAARLGHSSASTTLAVYVHVLPGQDEEAARRIDAALKLAGAHA